MTTRADSQHACPYVLERRVVIGRTSLHNRSLDFPRRSRPCRSTWPPRCRSRAAPQQPPSKASWRLSCLKPLARRCSATVSELARTTRRACRLVGNAIGNQPPDDGGSCSAVNGPLRDLFAYDTACTLRPSQPRGGRPRLARRGVRAHVSAPVPLYLPHRVNPLRTVLPSPVWKNCAKLPGGAGGGGVAAGCDVGYQQRGRGFEAAGGFHSLARAGRHGRQLACWPVGRGGWRAATEGGGGECPGLLSQLSCTL